MIILQSEFMELFTIFEQILVDDTFPKQINIHN
jgi:hypothetical protein